MKGNFASALLLSMLACVGAANGQATQQGTVVLPVNRTPVLRIAALPAGRDVPERITMAPVSRPTQAINGLRVAGPKPQLRMIANPTPVNPISVKRLAAESRLQILPSLRASTAAAAANSQGLAQQQGSLAFKPAGVAFPNGIALAPRRTEFAIASNPQPATWGAFPESGGLKTASAVYNGQQTSVGFLIRSSAIGEAGPTPTQYLLQYASEPTAIGSITDWKSPPGLLSSIAVQVAPQDSPIGPFDGNAILGWKPKTASYAYLTINLPPPFFGLRTAPGSFYARVLPMAARVRQPTPAAPASNWVRIDVPGTLAELQSKDAQKKADIAKANEEAAELKAAQEAQQLAAQAQKDKEAALWVEKLGAKLRIKDGYDVQALSYIPPKFTDDAEADRHLVLSTNISWQVDEKAFTWSKGETYEVGWAINLMNSDIPPLQQMWNLAEGILSGVSTGYEQAKDAAVNAAAYAINQSGVTSCGEDCKSKLKTGLEVALAYCGVPPSIPNTRELYSQGADYLAANIANTLVQQGMGIDIPLDQFGELGDMAKAEAREKARAKIYEGTRKGIDTVVSKLGCPDPSAEHCGVHNDNPYTWGVPDPYFRRRPAVVYIKITPRPGANLKGTSPVSLNIQASGAFDTQAILPLGYIPPQGVVVPIVLEASNPGWTPVAFLTNLTCSCGQPSYYPGFQTKIGIKTVHEVVSETGNGVFAMDEAWDTLDFQGSQVQDFQDGDIYNGYKGELKTRFVSLP